MTSDRPTIPAPRLRADVYETEFLSAALKQLAEHLATVTPDEISARKQAAYRRDMRVYVGLYASELGLRWAAGKRQSGEGDAEQGAGAHGPSVSTATRAGECAP